MEECNELLDRMRNKLARKEFEILNLYYNTENYKSAQIIARNFFKDYSYSEYCDDAYAILVKNNFEYARHSVESKKIERYTQCVEAYQNMKINCPTSDLLKEAGKYAEEAQNIIDKKEFKTSKKKEKKHED
jgi:outer membrane protein assembly factor BamD